MRTLEELKSFGVPRLSFRDVFKGVLCEDEEAQVSDYLSCFAGPTKECPQCEAPLSGFFGIPGWSWGLVHGEANCNQCGYPIRVYHVVRDRAKMEIVTFTLALPYHPDTLERN